MEKNVYGPCFSNNSFKTNNVLTRFHPANHTLFDDNQDNDCNGNHWMTLAKEPQAVDTLIVLLFTLELLKDQKYDHLCQLNPAIEASDSTSDFFEGNK